MATRGRGRIIQSSWFTGSPGGPVDQNGRTEFLYKNTPVNESSPEWNDWFFDAPAAGAAPPLRPSVHLSEQSPLALGVALGAVMVWTASALFAPAVVQPVPVGTESTFGTHESATRQANQAVYKWGTNAAQLTAVVAQPFPFGSSPLLRGQDQEQVQPWFNRPQLTAPAAAHPIKPSVVLAGQEDPFQPQPRFEQPQTSQRPVIHQAKTLSQEIVELVQPVTVRSWRLFFDNPPLRKSFLLVEQEDTSQTQPIFWRPQLTTPPPAAPIKPSVIIAGQEDPTQLQPVFWRQQLTTAPVVPPLKPVWFLAGQQDPTEIQPWFSQPQFLAAAEVPPIRRAVFLAPEPDLDQPQPHYTAPQTAQAPVVRQSVVLAGEVDADQPQPSFQGQQPPTLVAGTPPLRAAYLLAALQDPFQPQPWAVRPPPESQITPPPPSPGSGGMGGGGGGKWQEGLWEKIEAEMGEITSFAPPKDPAILPEVDAVAVAAKIDGLKGTLHLKKGLVKPPEADDDEDDDTQLRLLLLS